MVDVAVAVVKKGCIGYVVVEVVEVGIAWPLGQEPLRSWEGEVKVVRFAEEEEEPYPCYFVEMRIAYIVVEAEEQRYLALACWGKVM